MFVAIKQEMVLEPQTRAFKAPDTDFHNVSGAATKWRETTWNTSFRRKVCGAKPNDVVEHRNGVKIPKIWVLDLKECIKIFQVVCLESYYSETFNQMHADTSFSQQVVCVDEMAWNLQIHEFWT